MLGFIRKMVGTKHEREIKRMRPLVAAIGDLEPEISKLSDEGLRARTADFKTQIENGASLDDLLIPAFAVCREAGKRAVGMRPYDVQLIGGKVLHDGRIAEMKTGEGKTLVATLPCYLNGLSGKGVHVVTVNDYLAKRDAEWMGKVHTMLGLRTGVIHHGQGNAEKKKAYTADITYGQNNEFGFDYLRDNMKFSIYDYAQRDLSYAIVDEVDSILVDEARTPLIISGPGETASELYIKLNEIIPKLRKEEHYEVDEKSRQSTLTEEGMETAQRLLAQRGLLVASGSESDPYRGAPVYNLYDPVNLKTLHILQQCLRAHALYKRDVQYMVTKDEGKVMIIDEFTGRVLPGRRWSDGLHQAVEAKEHVHIQDENVTLATISFQNLFRLYDKLAGMTGTADTEATEFHKTYELEVVVIPTNKPIARADREDVVYKTEREKFHAIADQIEECHQVGQPVLVSTTSVEKSEVVGRLLDRKGIKVNVLNAKQHEREAYVVAQAGTAGAVTVATNMAGRGTDIVLGGNPEMLARMDVLAGHAAELQRIEALRAAAAEAEERGDEDVEIPEIPEFDMDAAIEEALPRFEKRSKEDREKVLKAGGLFILGTERHESRRIDNQLRGRSGRQGDPGESRFFLSLEDDLMRIFQGERIQTMMDKLGMEEGEPIEHKWVTKAVENAQQKVEERNFDIRKHLLEYDDVMNQQRKSIYNLRRQVLTGQYRTVPTEDEIKKGKKSEPVIEARDEELAQHAAPIIEQMIKHHGYPLAPEGAAPDEVAARNQKAQEASIEDLKGVRYHMLQRDAYLWFGCRLDLKPFKLDAQGALDFLLEEVGWSLTEQRERLLDLVEAIVRTMVEHACPPNKHFEDWDFDGLARAYKEQFGIEASGIEEVTEPQDMMEKLYGDAEAILLKKESEIGAEAYLRHFRNVYLQEIDRQWIDHLQSMDSLRDGIGLRGYGQRDPKREYKREGYDLFMQMTQSIKGAVATGMFRVRTVTEEDLQRQEAARRQTAERRLRGLRTSHADAKSGATDANVSAVERGAATAGGPNRRQRRRAAAQGAGAAPPEEAVPPPHTVRREGPKLGRNDPCWCGSGKKYKSCHYREDQAGAAP